MPTVRALPFSIRGPSRSGSNPYYDEAQAGAHTLDRQAEDRYRQEEQRIQQQHLQMENARMAVEQAQRDRQAAAAQALADKRIALEKRLELSLPNLIGIDPKSEDAEERYLKFGQTHAGDIQQDKSARAIYEQIGKSIDTHQKQQADIKSKLDAKTAARAAQDAVLTSPPEGFKADEVRREGVTLKSDAAKAGMTPERRQQLHEKQLEYIGKQLSSIENAATKPAWLNSTGAMKDPDGVMRFGFEGKRFDKDSYKDNPTASPSDIRQWRAYNDLKENYDLHDKALADLRASELAGTSPIDKTAVEADKTALSELPTDAPAAPVTNPTAGAPATPPPAPPEASGPAGSVTDTSPAAPAPTPHPLEGQAVKHKATGQTGKIINGEFVPD